MSKYLKPSLYNGKSAETQWLNIIWNTHDQICSCETPIDHLNSIVSNETCHHSTKETTTTATIGTGEKEETGFEEGDLEALFAENIDDDG